MGNRKSGTLGSLGRAPTSATMYALLVLCSMMPFWMWEREWLLGIVAVPLFFIILVLRLPVVKDDLIITLSVLFLLYFLLLALPIRPYDTLSIKNIANLSLVLIGLNLLRHRVVDSWHVLRDIFVFIVIVSVVSQLLFAIGLPFPEFNIAQGFRPQSGDMYSIYYGMVSLSTQVRYLGDIAIIRNCGWFGEPGHFGIYICLVLLPSDRPLAGWKNKILGVGVFSTLSAGAILIYCIMIMIKERSFLLIWLGAILFGFAITLKGVASIVLQKLSIGRSVLADRATYTLDLSSYDFLNYLLGKGSGYMSHLGRSSSNFDAFLSQYGLLSSLLFVMLLAFLTFFSGHKVRSSMLTFMLVSVLIAAHRSWMLDTLYFWYPAIVLFFCVRGNSSRAEASDNRMRCGEGVPRAT